MAYDRTKLRLLATRLVADGMQIWSLDTVDPVATVIGPTYISNAMKTIGQDGVGMSVGDKVIVTQWDNVTTKGTLISYSEHRVTAVALTGATLSAAGDVRPIIEDALAVSLVAGQSGGLVIFDKTDGAVITLPVPTPGLFFDFLVDVASASVGQKIITDAATTFIKGTVLQMTLADAANVADPANGTTHRSVNFNGTTTGGVAGTRVRLTCRTATIWEIEGLTIASGSVATSFAVS